MTSTGLPQPAICRGLQAVDVVLGGTLEQHMDSDHRHLVHPVTIRRGTLPERATGAGKTDVP
ncbi:gamma-glutamyl-gamma-aminobutyrate hydrolase family protein [Streptomyces sp. NPDC091972]|uniref:gamma-glutamyl-gamma-aminobutyrate hydrolase family protein n=1 Tax=Streptomyces sp. NPDC091972 TaxID=3366007 RepID=UPI00380E33EC